MAHLVVDSRFEIESSKYRCAACSLEVAVGSEYFSSVRFAAGDFSRQDFCASCWREADRSQHFAFWKTCRPSVPEGKQTRMRFDPAVVLELFRNLMAAPAGNFPAIPPGGETAETQYLGARRDELAFVLALLLVRKKLLAFRSSVEKDGGEWLVLGDREVPDRVYQVRNPALADADLERVRDDLGGLLGMRV